MIVFPDADLALAAKSIIFGATEDRGNRCISTKKVFAPRSVARQFEERLLAEAVQLKRGEPTQDDTDIGSLHAAARQVGEAALPIAKSFMTAT